MGRPIGSTNRQKPFNDALLMTLRSNPLALRRISAKLVEKAEEGDLAAIREIADRLDGKPAQTVDQRPTSVRQLTTAELMAIAAGELPELESLECDEDDMVLLPPPGPKSAG